MRRAPGDQRGQHDVPLALYKIAYASPRMGLSQVPIAGAAKLATCMHDVQARRPRREARNSELVGGNEELGPVGDAAYLGEQPPVDEEARRAVGVGQAKCPFALLGGTRSLRRRVPTPVGGVGES